MGELNELLAGGVHGCGQTSNEHETRYFSKYGRIEQLEWLLKDAVRNKAFRDAICRNEAIFRGKTVLDVGCGLGLLSLFAARAGAARVIAVDAASIVHYTRRIVRDNGYAATITIISGKIEEIQLPEGIDSVDIIVCDWMGHCLYAENVINSVLYARDMWLAPHGVIFPDTAHLYLTAIAQDVHAVRDVDFWSQAYGFEMSVIRRRLDRKACIERVNAEQLMSEAFLLKTLDLYSARYQSTDFSSLYELKLRRSGAFSALLTYFDVSFSKTPQRIGFSTSPLAPWTHWNQTVFHLDSPLVVKTGQGIKGVFGLGTRALNKRDLVFDIQIGFEGKTMNNKYYLLCN